MVKNIDTGVKPGKWPGSKLMIFRDLLSIDPSIICRILTINPYFKKEKSFDIKIYLIPSPHE